MPFFTTITWVVDGGPADGNPVGTPTLTPPQGAVNEAMYELLQNTIDNESRIAPLELGGGGAPGGYLPNLAFKTAGDGSVVESVVTDVELEYLDGVTSNIQTQIDNLNSAVNSGGDASGQHHHDSIYYQETELSTSGSSSVHWDNLTNIPGGGSGSTLDNQVVLTTSTTWTVPVDTFFIKISAIGGGGASTYDNSGGVEIPASGGGGGYISGYWTVVPGEIVTITIGSGGIATGVSGNQVGTQGGNTLVQISGHGGTLTAEGANARAVLFGGGGSSTLSGLRGSLIMARGGAGILGRNNLVYSNPYEYPGAQPGNIYSQGDFDGGENFGSGGYVLVPNTGNSPVASDMKNGTSGAVVIEF